MAYIGNGQFAELRRKIEPSDTIGITCKMVMPSAGDIGTTSSANENNSRSTTSTLTLRAIGTIKSDPDTLDELLS